MRSQLLFGIVLLIAMNSSGLVAAQEDNFTEALMRSTFKLTGTGSVGTAFILGRPDPSDEDGAFYVLITAAHVLNDIKDEHATLHLRTHKDGLYERRPSSIRIRNGKVPVWKSNKELDLAAMHIPIPEDADILLAGTELLGTDDTIRELELSVGDEVFVLGYPYGAEANGAGFPILRSGKIASFPLVPTAETKTFLLDFEVFAGNSGGPVFINQGVRKVKGNLMSGTFVSVLGLESREKVYKEKLGAAPRGRAF